MTWKQWIFPLVIVVWLLADQTLKVWVKTTFRLGEELVIFPWFRLHFVENYGMAFGIQWGGEVGKVILTGIRIVLTVVFLWMWWRSWRRSEHPLIVLGLSCIVAGALGNMIDSIFYGVLFTESTYFDVARFAPGKGYAPLFHGRVVDMLYFPIWEGFLPEWLPLIGGRYFVFFAPVFNLADTAITVGFLLWLVGTWRVHPKRENHRTDTETDADTGKGEGLTEGRVQPMEEAGMGDDGRESCGNA